MAFAFTLLMFVSLFINDAFSKEISNVVYGSVTQLNPLIITPAGGDNISIKIDLNDETKVIVEGRTGSIHDLRLAQHVEVKYIQFERASKVSRVAKEIRSIPKVNEVESLLAAQNDIEYSVKVEASRALFKLGKAAVPLLIAVLNDKNRNQLVRINAAGALGRTHDIRAIEPLIEVLTDKYWLLRDMAAIALAEISGQNFGKDPIQWRNWWQENKERYLNLLGDCIQQKPYSQENKYPCWLRELIARGGSVWRCIYKNQIVYYLPPRCCDIPSVLYNEPGNIICSPDGGFTGRGDGRCQDFFEERKNCEAIGKDTRSYP